MPAVKLHKDDKKALMQEYEQRFPGIRDLHPFDEQRLHSARWVEDKAWLYGVTTRTIYRAVKS